VNENSLIYIWAVPGAVKCVSANGRNYPIPTMNVFFVLPKSYTYNVFSSLCVNR